MKQGPQKIAEGLWQSAMAHVTPNWETLRSEVDYLIVMADRVEHLPGDVPMVSFPIDDNADGCYCFAQVRALAETFKDKRVLTICHMGENRSGLVSALILVARGVSPEDAVRMVQDKGSHNSATQPHSFWNPGFVRQVKELAV